MPMSELVQRLDRGTLPNDAVAITFDDGYVDNLREAKPRLVAAGFPATLFLMAGAVGQPTEFWWDEIARGILGRREALDCEITVSREPCRIAFAALDASADSGSDWRAWEEPRSEREIMYLALWRRLRAATAIDREAALSRWREASGTPPPSADDLPMSETDVAAIGGDGLFEIGGHTLTHPVLPLLDPTERRREILEGKQVCERLVNRPVTGFAYPHGAMDSDSRAAVQECGFRWACSTESTCVSPVGFDRYALPRIFVLDWDGPEFERALAAASAHQPGVSGSISASRSADHAEVLS
jgi:peptidoglycan/xylan/chitin deacetylase (PgdA/CDA1 family)